jgi:hypothetical protein
MLSVNAGDTDGARGAFRASFKASATLRCAVQETAAMSRHPESDSASGRLHRVRHRLAAVGVSALLAGTLLAPGTASAWESPPAKGAVVARAQVDDVELHDNPWDTAEFDDIDSLTRHLIRTASRLSKYRPPAALPMVSRIERAALEQLACPQGAVRCNVSAMYLPHRGVLIADDLRPESNLFHRSILLHELVHYLQDDAHELMGASECDRWYQREIEAYALQNRFLANIYSPDRVAYSGSRPQCTNAEPAVLTHRAKEIKAPNLVD